MTDSHPNDAEMIAFLAGLDAQDVNLPEGTEFAAPSGASTGTGTGTDTAALTALRELLADPATWAEPPAHLGDSVVAEIGALAAEQQPQPPAPAPALAPVSLAARRDRRWLRPLVAAAAAVALVVGGVVAFNARRDQAPAALTFHLDLQGTELAPAASGVATLTKSVSGWRISLDATGLPRRDNGDFYQAWLRSADGTLVPIGTFNEGSDVVLWAGVSPKMFTMMTVTEESADNVQNSSGRRVLVGTLTLPSSPWPASATTG